MRDILVFVLVFGSIPAILKHPYIGVIVWSWLGYMNPHRLTWGPAYDFPFAQVVAIALIISIALSKEEKKLPVDGITITWLFFLAWMTVTTFFAYYPDAAQYQLIKVLKIQLIVFLTMMIMRSRERIDLMIWTIYLSVGFFGIKGGVFTIVNAGSYRVLGPAGSFIADNNHLAVALLMIMPLGLYLYQSHSDRKIRIGLVLSEILIFFSIVASYSRGAFLAVFCVVAFLWIKSKQKLLISLIIIPLIPVAFLFMPEGWHERMSSIAEYEQDASAMGRLNAWQYAVNVANSNLTGVGFESWSLETFAKWAPDPTAVHAAHSIYFAMLADHGWIGLLFFLGLFVAGWRTSGRLIKLVEYNGDQQHLWMANLSRMIQVSLIAYASGGAFLSLAYFDLPWHLLAIIVLMKHVAIDRNILHSEAPRTNRPVFRT